MTGVPDTRGVARGEVVVTRIADTTKMRDSGEPLL